MDRYEMEDDGYMFIKALQFKKAPKWLQNQTKVVMCVISGRGIFYIVLKFLRWLNINNF